MTNQHKDPSVIPEGMYCYHGDTVCPYWSCDVEYEDSDWMKMRPDRYGKCAFLGISDKDPNGPITLWDQVKECDINMHWEDDEGEIIVINP